MLKTGMERANQLRSGQAPWSTATGLVVIAGSLRGARGIGGFHRHLARSLLDEHIEDPEPFVARPGFSVTAEQVLAHCGRDVEMGAAMTTRARD